MDNEKGAGGYEPVDQNAWGRLYSFDEFIRAIGSGDIKVEDEPVFINKTRNLSVTIKDGDYTLREGIDYAVSYYRGGEKSEMTWKAVGFGIGKYSKIVFFMGEYRLTPDERTLRQQPGYKEFMERFYPDEEI